MVTIKQMRYFDALVQTRHFGRAAQLVHVSQPALSAQIMELEAALGTKLVERNRTRILLTREGEALLPRMQHILAEVAELEQASQHKHSPLSGIARIGAIPTVAPYLVPRLVPYLRAAYPRIEIELREAITDKLLLDLEEGRLDAVVAALPVVGDSLSARPLLKDRFFMAMADTSRDVLASPLTGAEIDPGRLLLLEEGHCLRDQALDVCSAARPNNVINIGATSMTTLLQMVTHDLGMTLVPEMALEAETVHHRLRVVPFAPPEPAREIGLIWRRSNPHIADIDALAEAIIATTPRVGNLDRA
ncbi:MAG: LysR substrate-binding domain-containing protein [Chelatococcus sp.]|nr:hydrogen peroxide-inducible genes activator [Chelatococcus sp.]MBS7741871.1 LysR family transcriptional regulator [Chelatococcus sp. HY11]CAH1648759.1 Hydrogen peroxide-inducible genes activator [Hyphomicrobiales bacterium]MBX3541331.1 LysR family transcriptional regulator [Chelatococcus sp.]MCO5074776.1 LysR substrate-binding domain-containing protein [Chelatococcus sp.]CAH1691379.1 Hydrogen peroxide-inducible genes activator [Hyphomicrobiales bacterium]